MSGADPVGREQRLDVVALFVDMSGFTAMSEALGKVGKAGTEELTDVLNGYFDPMIELVQSYGGIVGKFGGDAMTVLFPYARSRSDRRDRAARSSVRSTCRAAWASTPRSRPAPVPSAWTMKAGLALGPVLCTIVGDPAIRLEYIIAGEVLDRCADAEHHATSGDVVVHNELLPYIMGRRDCRTSAATLRVSGGCNRVHANLLSRQSPTYPQDADTACLPRFCILLSRACRGRSERLHQRASQSHRAVRALRAAGRRDRRRRPAPTCSSTCRL